MQPRHQDSQYRPERRFQSLDPGGMETTFTERGLLWALLPKFALGQSQQGPFPCFYPPHREAGERETSQRQPAKVSGKQESRSQPQSPWAQAWEEGPPHSRKAQSLLCLWPPGPQCRWLVLSARDKGSSCKQRMVWASDWRLQVSFSHPERCSLGTSQPFSSIRWDRSCRMAVHALSRTQGGSFATLPATAIPPVAPRGLSLGSHQARFPRAPAPHQGQVSPAAITLPNHIQGPELSHSPQVLSPCNRIFVFAEQSPHSHRLQDHLL